MRRRWRALAAAVVVLLGATASATAQPQPAVNAVAEAADYATDAFADPWDFTNAEDVHTWSPAVHGGSAVIAEGRLRFSTQGAGGGHLFILFPGFGGTVLAERDGDRIPLDANHYRTAVLRIRSSAPMTAAVVSRTCPGVDDPCETSTNMQLEPRWQTYLVPVGVTGPVHGLRLAVASGPVDLDVDWIRVVADPIDSVDVGGDAVFWDADADPANNTPDHAGWGSVPPQGFPAAAYPPGEYRFYRDAGAYSAPLHVLARPALEILDPDLGGGEDYITATTGDAWDFDQASDGQIVNARDVTVEGGVVSATNTNGDPHVLLRMGPAAIDPNRYHRMTATFRLDGPFSLGFGPGGGAHGRLLWAYKPGQWINGNDLVAYPNLATHTVDLNGGDARESSGDPPWSTAPIVAARFDPHEDSAARRWYLDELRLAADDETSAEGFDVTFADRAVGVAAPAGTTTTYEVFADTDRSGFDGIAVAAGTVTAEQTVARWNTCDAAPGRYELHVRVTRSGGGAAATSDSYASGPLVVRAEDTACEPEEPDRTDLRLAGPTRVDTAAAVAREAFAGGADTAVVVTADAFADALAAAPVAGSLGGPVLLTSRDALPEATAVTLDDLSVERVLVLGGTAAVSQTVVTALEDRGLEVERIAGEDRFATAAAAARRLGGGAGEAVLAAGGTFPDALAGGWRAASLGLPLLLVGSDSLPTATVAALEDLGIQAATLVGGAAVVSDSVLAELEERGVDTTRVAGEDRYATARAVAEATLPRLTPPTGVLAASGEAFPDALSAAPAAAVTGRLLLLTARDSVPQPTAELLASVSPIALLAAGGPAAIAPATLSTLAEIAGAAATPVS